MKARKSANRNHTGRDPDEFDDFLDELASSVHQQLADFMGEPVGFALAVYTQNENTPEIPNVHYMSNCSRHVFVMATRELVARWREGAEPLSTYPVPPSTTNTKH